MPTYEIRSNGMNGHRPVYNVEERDVWDLLRYINVFYGKIRNVNINTPESGNAVIDGQFVYFKEVQ